MEFLVFYFIFLLFCFLINKQIPIDLKFFYIPFIITQSLRGAGYFNGGFSLIVFLMLFTYVRLIKKENMKLSIIIPCYNEEKTLKIIIERVLKFKDLEKEIIIVDDCSTDNSKFIIKDLADLYPEIRGIFLEKNFGKGSALKKGFEEVSGDIVLIQDADLEYDPKDYSALIKPFKNTDADVVYGSRFMGGDYVRLHFFGILLPINFSHYLPILLQI